MRVIFLGTGTSQGVPVIGCDCPVCRSIDFQDKRLRASIYIETENVKLVVDTGPDFRQQMLRERIKELDAVLFTHAHKDHTAGLDDIRSYNFRQRRDMPLYGQAEVLEQIKVEFSYVFSEKKYPGVPQVELNPIVNKSFEVKKEIITPISVWHYKLPVFGYRIKNFTYITDAKTIDEDELEKIRGTEVLAINALQKDPHISHLTLEEALEVIEKVQPKKAFLTHISHKLGRHRDVKNELPENVELAYDGLELSL